MAPRSGPAAVYEHDYDAAYRCASSAAGSASLLPPIGVAWRKVVTDINPGVLFFATCSFSKQPAAATMFSSYSMEDTHNLLEGMTKRFRFARDGEKAGMNLSRKMKAYTKCELLLLSGSPIKAYAYQEVFPMAWDCCMSPTSVGVCAKVKLVNGSLRLIEEETNLAGQGKCETIMQHNSSDGCRFTGQEKNEISVGPDYQAQIPQWTGEVPVNYDDPETQEWLGTKVWPPINGNSKALCCGDPIGKGREVDCGCNLPGSVECVRFHVAEQRFKLRRELGVAFYAWGFDRMGEEIALSWTDEEEASFKAVCHGLGRLWPNGLAETTSSR